MNKIIYPLRDLSLGLVTAGEESERPWNSCSVLTNYLWDRRWKRKSGSAIYNATYMHATEECRGGFTFNDGTINCVLAVCNGSFYKTTGDGSMGSALTRPDGSAVTIANADLDCWATQIRNRLYIFNGDVTDHYWVFDGTYVQDYDLELGTEASPKDATDGSTTTLIDTVNLTQTTTDYWELCTITITDAGDNTKYRGYITAFDPDTDKVTFSPARDSAVVSGDTYVIGVPGCEEHNLKFATLHKNRIFGAVGSLLYYTVPYYPDWWGPEDGYVTLKKVGWNDGEDITALAVMDDNLIIFKPHNIYAIRCWGKHYNWGDGTKIVGTDSNKGCVWHKTLKRGFGGLIYHSWDGVYVLDRSLNVHCVNRNIEPTIKALQQSVSNPGGMSSVTKTDTTKVHFDAGTPTNIDTATESGTFRVAKTGEAKNQYQETQNNDYPTYYYTLAQSFKPSIDCICTKLELYLKKVGTPGSDLTVYLKADNNNSPGDTLASITISEESITGTYTFVEANITDTNLSATADRYWIYTPKVGTSGNTYYWGFNTAGGYANGNLWSQPGGHGTEYDTAFRVYEQHYQTNLTDEGIEQSYTTGQDTDKSQYNFVAQSFTTSKVCICTKLQLYLKKVGVPTQIYVYLREDNNNFPYGNILATKTIFASDVTTSYDFIDVDFSDVNLTDATKYWIYVDMYYNNPTDYIAWGVDATSPAYDNGNWWTEEGDNDTTTDALFKVYEQHYTSNSNLIGQWHDFDSAPTAHRPFIATEILNDCTVAWQIRTATLENKSDATAWSDVENGGTPTVALGQYQQWKCIMTATYTATPIIEDVTMQVYTGTAVNSPCGIVYNKKYWLSVQDTSSNVNSCIWVLDEEALMYEQHERWSKLTGLYINDFLIFNDQLIGTSVGGTGKGGFLYYLDTGTKDLGEDFTTILTTQKLDFSNLDLTYRDREKIYKKLLSKYKSQQDANLYYKIDDNSWSSAVTLSAQANVDIEEDWFVGLQRGKYLTLKITQANADKDFEWHSIDILARIARLRG